MPMQCFIHVKVNFAKKIQFFPLRNFPTSFPGLFPFPAPPTFKGKALGTRLEISVSCTSQKYDYVTTPYYPFAAPLFVNWSLTGG